MILCGAVGLCLLLFANKEAVVSEEENRTLAAMPSLTTSQLAGGSFDEAFEDFLCDKFFLRTEIVDVTSSLKHIFSALTVDELIDQTESDEEAVMALLPQEPAQEEPSAQETAAEIPEQEPEQDAQESKESASEQQTVQSTGGVTPEEANVWLLHADGTRSALLTYAKADIERAANVFKSYAALLPADGTLHVLLVPRSQTANKLALHLDTESGWSSDLESALVPLVSDNVVVHSAVDILCSHIVNGEYIFFRTDHHWTALGAYYAANAMIQSEGYPTVPLSDYASKSIEGFLGSIYLHGRSAKLKELADTLTYYEPLAPAESFWVSNTYRKSELKVIDTDQNDYKIFLGGTHGPYRVLDGGYHTGRNMLMVCDSFGNAIAPFLMPYYDSVYMVDFRDEYYSKEAAQGGVAEYIRRCGIQDIYVVLSESEGVGTAFINQLMPANLK
jgi:hypothetical protein